MQHLRDMFRHYKPIHPKAMYLNERVRPDDYDCPEEVKKTFHELHHSVTYSFKGNIIRFFYTDDDCDTLIQHVARLLSVLQIKPVIADILLTSAKKFYPKNRIFGQSNLNGGYCTGDKIVVFRKEEWFKVFIHELFHYNEFDKSLRGIDSSIPIQTAFNLSHPIMVNESYCEVSARVIQCCFISSLTHFPIDYLLEIERTHSIQNMVNVLHHMEMNYESFFKRHDFKEDTNVFAYVVIGGILMYANFVPVYHKDTKFEMLRPEAYVRKILTHCKDDDMIQELSLLATGTTTTMSVLKLIDFSV